jgi:CheY-like chemotaxis protein
MDSTVVKPSVLVVEDEFIVAAYLKMLLQRNGFTVAGTISTGEEAVESVAEMKPDVIIMDVNLAGAMNGIEAANAISSKTDIPFLFMTAHASFYENLVIGHTRVHVIDKPFEEKLLLNTLRKLTGLAA